MADEATVIVSGNVTKIQTADITRKFDDEDRRYDVAVVEVKEVLKGDKKLKEVRIAQPAPAHQTSSNLPGEIQPLQLGCVQWSSAASNRSAAR